jgi:hypothetical protein
MRWYDLQPDVVQSLITVALTCLAVAAAMVVGALLSEAGEAWTRRRGI